MEQTKAPIEHSLICGAPKSKEYAWSGYRAYASLGSVPEYRKLRTRGPWEVIVGLCANMVVLSAIGAIGLVFVSTGHMLAGTFLTMFGFCSVGIFLCWIYGEMDCG